MTLLTFYDRIFLAEAKVKHQPQEEPLTHAVFDLHSAQAKQNQSVVPHAERNRKHQERRVERLARTAGSDLTSAYPRQSYQDHGEHAHQLARIQVARHDKVGVARSGDAIHFSGEEKDRTEHAHRFAGSMDQLHGKGTASVVPHNRDTHKVSLKLPEHSDEERRAHAEHHKRLLDDAHTRMVKTGGEHIEMRSKPRTLGEKMFMQSVKSGATPTRPITDKSTKKPIEFGEHPDPKFKDWHGYHKHMAVLKADSGKKVVIHLWQHPKTGHRVGFKFKPQSNA